MTVTVKKIGGSVAVVIPRGIAREIDLVEGASLEISATADAILMRKRGRLPRRSITQIASKIKSADYKRRSRTLSNDGPVGKEIW